MTFSLHYHGQSLDDGFRYNNTQYLGLSLISVHPQYLTLTWTRFTTVKLV